MMNEDRMKMDFDTARSIGVRIFINFIGKVHMPLNAATLVNNDFK